MIVKHLIAEKTIEASKESIFKILSNHEGTPSWVEDVNEVTIVRKGEVKNGKGTVREVEFKPKLWTTVQEEVTDFQENDYFKYSIINGMPGLLKHIGKWSVEDVGNGKTKVIWDVYFEFKKLHWFALFVGNFANTFNKVQHKALESLNNKVIK